MTLLSILSLLSIMLVLAAVPSASVALVVARSATRGFANGVAVTVGIVLGDLFFVLLAVWGMSLLAESMGAFFAIIRYLGAAYLIWIGVSLLRSRASLSVSPERSRGSLGMSFLAGLFLTLGDVKAIVFYASLFPAFVEVSQLTLREVGMICLVTVLAVGGVKLVYALMAERLMRRMQGTPIHRGFRKTAGGLMVGTGVYLIAKS